MFKSGPDLSKSLHSSLLVFSHVLFSTYVERDGGKEKGRPSVLLMDKEPLL